MWSNSQILLRKFLLLDPAFKEAYKSSGDWRFSSGTVACKMRPCKSLTSKSLTGIFAYRNVLLLQISRSIPM